MLHFSRNSTIRFSLLGFKKLKKVDRDAVILAQAESKKENLKRPRVGSDDKSPSVKKAKTLDVNDDERNALRLQSQRLWKLRDHLEREVSKDALVGLLEYNKQHVPSGLSNLLDAVSDAMLFGALPTCPSCKNGPLSYSNGQYKCSAMATEWAACVYRTREVERIHFRIPKEYHDVDFLKKYKYVKRTRLFAADSVPPVTGPLSRSTVLVTDSPHDSGKTKEALIDELKALGAVVTHKLSSGVIVVSSPTSMEQTMNPDEKSKAKSLGLRIVNEAFIGHLKTMSTIVPEAQLTKLLKKYTLSDWAVTPIAAKAEKPQSGANFRESDDVVRCKLKGGAVVDPESGLESCASVMRDSRGNPMSAVLGMVDLIKGSNSFYKLQALQADSGLSFWVFRAWGRIGTTIGGTKLEKYTTFKAARDEFKALYFEKTGNEWKDRANFRKKPHKFYEMELDYTDAEAKSQTLDVAHSVPSKLHPTLQALIRFICDIESMKKTMVEFDLDLRKMPLGKLSKRQIHEAYSILGNLSKLIDQCSRSKLSVDQTTLLSESTRFFTLIPHDFGMNAPPLLDSRKAIRDKLQMLEDLLEIELAYNMLMEDVKSDVNPLDQHYKQLKTTLKPLDPKSEEYSRIVDYVKRNHGSTHNHYSLQVDTVFVVERSHEKARFANYKGAQHNKQLLWHGSRRTNWMGILSQGLRIAPPEAPTTGYMFGKGIYFADVVSKAANYCFTSQSQPDGLLLLCEVILGNMKECLNAESTQLPPGQNSRKGVGSVTPDPCTHYTNPDGVLYPIGNPVPSGVSNTSLIYNEYIVYDAAQVKQKYLVRVKFVY